MNKIIILIFGLFCFVNAQQWTIIGNMPNPVSDAESVVKDSSIIILGGFSESLNSSVDIIREYTPSSGTWEDIGTLKEKRSSFSSGIFNDSVFSFGGIPSNQANATSMEIWRKNNTSKLYSADNSFERTNTTGLILDNNYYFFGGNTSVLLPSYLVEYNLTSKLVAYSNSTIFSLMPAQQMSASDGKYIYLFGGVFLGVSRNIYRFNPVTKEYILLTVLMSTPRAGGRAVFYDSTKIMIIGGYNETSSALSSTEIFNIDDTVYTISPGPSLNHARKDFMASVVKDVIYIFAGKDGADNTISSIEKFDKVTSVNSEPGSLSTYKLDNNFPNPFNPSTTINFSLNKRSFIKLKVLDINGREIAELVNEEKDAGEYQVVFEPGKYSLTSGIYFCSLASESGTSVIKMAFIK